MSAPRVLPAPAQPPGPVRRARWARWARRAVTGALLDMHALEVDDGAWVAAWSARWRYVWPRDASFVAAADLYKELGARSWAAWARARRHPARGDRARVRSAIRPLHRRP